MEANQRLRAMAPVHKHKRLPPWLKRAGTRCVAVHRAKASLRKGKLNTVCEQARCPNIGECFALKTATYLILGNICTRKCLFCAIAHGDPQPPDPDEPQRVAAHAARLGMRHVVITSVTRDDLVDGGAGHFALTVAAVRRTNPESTIEILTPDFGGSRDSLRIVCEAKPHVFNHNIETVRRLTPRIRSQASYDQSLDVLAQARRILGPGRIKSGIMLGLGEREDEVIEAIRDLKDAGCDMLTMGQYLPPRSTAMPVASYVHPNEFTMLARRAKAMGFASVVAGPNVRSSYHAADAHDAIGAQKAAHDV